MGVSFLFETNGTLRNFKKVELVSGQLGWCCVFFTVSLPQLNYMDILTCVN